MNRLPRVRSAPFATAATVWGLITFGLSGYLAVSSRHSTTSQALGNLGILLALLFSCVVCARAAKRSSEARWGWALMSLAWLMAALGQVLYTLRAAAGDSLTPSPVLDTFAYLGYSVPVIAALYLFPKAPAHPISKYRGVLDAVVITLGVLFLSEATVLRPVREAGELQGLAAWSGLAYPIADLAICSIVFTLGMRQQGRRRLVWLWMGSGLLILTLTDSIYVRLLADGHTDLTGSPLVLGWMAAPLLTALAALIPEEGQPVRTRNLALLAQLVPYVPVLGAVIVAARESAAEDPFLLATGALLLLAVAIRQVTIVYENVTLTRDLEDKVSARTAELATLGSIMTSSSDAVVGISLKGVVTAWNTAAEELYGLRAGEVIGRPPTFLPEEFGVQLQSLLERSQQGDLSEAYEIDWTRPDGRTVPVALRVSPIQSGNVVEGISVFGQDITARRRAEAALEQARQEALEASRLKSEFLATMSHEIRTPMNGVIGLTALLLETELTNQQRRYAEGVLGAGEALLGVINDILDFSKLEAGKVMLDPTSFDPSRLVEDVGALLAPAASAKRLELLTYCLPGVPAAVRGDAGRIRQVLLNLASNAVKFTLEGEVVVRLKSTELPDQRVRLRFEVRDTGIGLAEDDRDSLFESFSQADASTTRRFGGTGLGLAISRRLVEVMGGEIGVESAPGEGSVFWFETSLPVEASTVDTQSTTDSHVLTDLRVLIVDDNATNREITSVQLARWQLRPETAASAPVALEHLRRASSLGRPFDLVVLDMLMPEVDGLQLAREISADPELSGTRMLLLTSSFQLEPEVLRDAGIEQWLTKPVRASELYDTVLRLISQPEPEPDGVAEPQQPSLPATLGRVLVVEDNSINRMVAEGLLARLGYQSESVVNGLEAVEAYQRASFAAILMDCHMPVMDGFTATREIRKQEAGGRRIPIIAMTAGALTEDRERCLAAGMDDYVSKPVSAQGLSDALSSWVGKSVTGGEPQPVGIL